MNSDELEMPYLYEGVNMFFFDRFTTRELVVYLLAFGIAIGACIYICFWLLP